MKQVKLYIEATYKGLRPQDGRYGYVLACETSRGLFTSAGAGREMANFQRLGLMAALDALGRMRKPSDIMIITDCAHLVSAYMEGWLDKWQENGWKSTKGKEIVNHELWEQLYKYSQVHLIDADYAEKHEFSSVLLAEMEMANLEIGQKTRLDTLETRRNT